MTITIEPDTISVLDWMANDQTRTPIVSDEFASGADRYRSLLTQVSALWREPDDDEEYVRPSSAAFNRTIDLLEQSGYALMQLHGEFPTAYVSTDDRGGIRIEWWFKRSRCVHLVVHSDQADRDYVFVKLTDEDGTVERPVRPARLASKLTEIQALRTANP
jgi:hypothetical protein